MSSKDSSARQRVRTWFVTLGVIIFGMAFLVVPVAAQCNVDFEDLPPGSQFGNGEIFDSGGVTMVVDSFFLGPNCTDPFAGGVAFVGGSPCGSGNELGFQNVNVHVDFGGPVTNLELGYGYFGGSLNLMVNGECVWAPDPFSFPPVVGGVEVMVVGEPCGMMVFTGEIVEFSIGGQEFFIDCLNYDSGPPPDCDIDFEDLPFGIEYPSGAEFVTGGVPVSVGDYFFGSGCTNPFSGGSASVVSSGCGFANELNLNNVNLDFDFGGPVMNLELVYGYFGGTINLEINGDCVEAFDPSSLPPVVGGVQVVAAGVPCGVLGFIGVINSFRIGGQELVIDCLNYDLAPPPDCDIDFEDLPFGMDYPNGSGFVTGGVPVSVGDYFFGPGCTDPFSGGFATVVSSGCGFANELNLNNVNLDFDFGGPVMNLEFIFGYYGGSLNLEVNGDCVVVSGPAALPPTLGGVDILVGGGGPCGVLAFNGVIASFRIGGQEFTIDCLTYDPAPPPECDIHFEDLPFGMDYPNGSSFVTAGVPVSVEDYFFGAGCTDPFGGGFASVVSLGCGFANEVNLNNVNLDFDFGGPVMNLELIFGYYGGSLNLEVNGDCVVVAGPAALPPTLGGVDVLVSGGGPCGVLAFNGVVTSFRIGGQEFTIDCLNYEPSDVGAFIRGDVNGDGSFIGVVDGVYLLNFGFTPGSPPPPCLEAADTNSDSVVNALVDGVFLLNCAFVPGTPCMGPPFPGCGPDPDPANSLGCVDDSGCSP